MRAKEYQYNRKDLAKGKTHDELWNPAQRQMLWTGKKHGYLRMYLANKLIEWSESP